MNFVGRMGESTISANILLVGEGTMPAKGTKFCLWGEHYTCEEAK